MKRTILIIFIVGAFLGQALAAYELQSVNLDLVNKRGTVVLRHGDFIETNSVLTNGDIEETNSFVPDSPPATISSTSTGDLFSALIGEMIQDNAVNTNQFTADTTGQSNVSIPGQDSTVVEFPASLTVNVNWDEFSILKANGDNWATITSIIKNVNWTEVNELNGLAGTNWASLTGINWNNWPVQEASGQNWPQFILTGGQ